MVHERLEFEMPASTAVAFDAFHFHEWRSRWDSLVSETRVQGGAPCPFVGAVTENTGRGVLRAIDMRTKFVTFDRPHLAAATMLGRAFPFEKWAAAMRHEALGPERSRLVYTYTFTTGPRWLRWVLEPIVGRAFARQTRQRFARMACYLAAHADDIARWQRSGGTA